MIFLSRLSYSATLDLNARNENKRSSTIETLSNVRLARNKNIQKQTNIKNNKNKTLL
jgi:hypothetical protein